MYRDQWCRELISQVLQKILSFFTGIPAYSCCYSWAIYFWLEVFLWILRVVIAQDEVRGTLLCVQDFVKSPHFTQRNFFSDSGVGMQIGSTAISNSITTSVVYELWIHLGTGPRSQVIAESCACVDRAVDRRRAIIDTLGVGRGLVVWGRHQRTQHLGLECGYQP